MTQKLFTIYMAIISCIIVAQLLYALSNIEGGAVCEDNKFVGEICKGD
jgi:hypothetical protein